MLTVPPSPTSSLTPHPAAKSTNATTSTIEPTRPTRLDRLPSEVLIAFPPCEVTHMPEYMFDHGLNRPAAIR